MCRTNMYLALTFCAVIVYLPSRIRSLPPDACFQPFKWQDCGQPPKPVMYYWKSGSRCEVGFWRGCVPNLNMFKDEYECVATCIFSPRARAIDYHSYNALEYDDKDDDGGGDDSVTSDDDVEITTVGNSTTDGGDNSTGGTTSGGGGGDVTGGTGGGGDVTGKTGGGGDVTGNTGGGGDVTTGGGGGGDVTTGA